ncbi:hypothetical protein PGT21_035819 [Puccinia graminis f. sp. tritici]|uniref:Uncharacterized protein n=1 Tax=Puccinia graminis f. sp. tritici TaxID=56615 RepID=A0A5B0MNH5_PUCGR|nr:hypothetical protein PGT21_035819 [Puccinia graminis f. sp. tritici]
MRLVIIPQLKQHSDSFTAKAAKPKTERQLRLENEKAERAIARNMQDQRKIGDSREKSLNFPRKEVYAGKVADSIKRFSYLLGQTELFRHFCNLKEQREPEFAKLLPESENKCIQKKTKPDGQHRGQKTVKEDDEELLAADKQGDDSQLARYDEPFVFTESPSYTKGGSMRDYQVQG